MQLASTRSLRRSYLDWVEEQLENYKESIPRADLLRLAEETVEELRVNLAGQYQLSELLLCAAVDRKIFRLLGLPSFRGWIAARRPPAASPTPAARADAQLRVEMTRVCPHPDTPRPAAAAPILVSA